MTEKKDLWLESQAQVRLDKWCDELGWPTRRYAWDVEITVDHHVIHANPVRVQETPMLCLVLPLAKFPDHFRGPWDTEALLFILRRNSYLATMNWCVTRDEGLSVQAYRPMDALDIEKLAVLASSLVAERADFLALVCNETAARDGAKA